MTTFEYPTPDWVNEPAESAIEIESLGALSSTLTDVLASVMTAETGVLPRRSPDTVDYSLWELMFLERYAGTHMTLVNDDVRAQFAEAKISPWRVLVHTSWERTIADVFDTMAHNVRVGRMPYPQAFQGTEMWARHLEFFSQKAREMADFTDEDLVEAT